jgi:hypothetical protein
MTAARGCRPIDPGPRRRPISKHGGATGAQTRGQYRPRRWARPSQGNQATKPPLTRGPSGRVRRTLAEPSSRSRDSCSTGPTHGGARPWIKRSRREDPSAAPQAGMCALSPRHPLRSAQCPRARVEAMAGESRVGCSHARRTSPHLGHTACVWMAPQSARTIECVTSDRQERAAESHRENG